MLAVIKQRDFSLLWTGQAVSYVGDFILEPVLLFWVNSVTGGSALALSAMLVCRQVPLLLFGPAAGVFVDRWDKRRTMILADLIRAGLAALLLLSIALRAAWPVYIIGFLMSSAACLFRPAKNALIPRLVAPTRLVAANSLLGVTVGLSVALGPAIGAAIWMFFGPTSAFLFDAGTFLFSALMIWLIRVPAEKAEDAGPHEAGRPFLSELAAGLRHALGSRPISGVTVSMMLTMLGGGGLQIMELTLITRSLHLRQEYTAVLMSASGFAMLAATLFVSAIAVRLRPVPLYTASLAILALSTFVLAYSPVFTVALLAAILSGLANSPLMTAGVTILQAGTAPAYRGRVFATYEASMFAAQAASMAIAGPLVGLIGPRLSLCCAGVLVTLAALYAVASLAGERAVANAG